MDSTSTLPPPSAAMKSPEHRLTFLEFARWMFVAVVVSTVSDIFGAAILRKIEPPPPSIAPGVYAAVYDDLQQNLRYVLAFVVCLVTCAALMKWGERTRRWMLPWIFASISGVRAIHALLIVFLCPGLLTGTLTSLRWSTRDEYQSAHLDYWSTGVVIAAALLFGEFWVRVRKRRVA